MRANLQLLSPEPRLTPVCGRIAVERHRVDAPFWCDVQVPSVSAHGEP